MSANNWRKCPRCHKVAEQEQQAAKQKAKDAYGKVSPEQYIDLLAEVPDPELEPDRLRENWQLGINTKGQFYVRYSASCERCSFTHTYKFDQQLNVEANQG